MDINNKARIQWSCRRGMRELDVMIMPFFENDYDGLSDAQKADFIRLLDCQDPDLFRWTMNQSTSEDAALQSMVELIQERHKARGTVPY